MSADLVQKLDERHPRSHTVFTIAQLFFETVNIINQERVESYIT